MDGGYVKFPKEIIDLYEKIGCLLEVDEENGMFVEGIFDYGCIGDEE